MSFNKGQCPVCGTSASAECRNCGLRSSPFEAAVLLGGGDLLIAAEATRRVESTDPLVAASLDEVRWISRMRAWAGAMIQTVELAIRKVRPNPKDASDDERRWLSESAKNPLVIGKIADLTVESVTKLADKIDATASSVNAKRLRRPVLGESEASPSAPVHALRSGAEPPADLEERRAFFKTAEGQAWIAEHFDDISSSASQKAPSDPRRDLPAVQTAVPASGFVPPYHLGG